ncbi:MAG: hypothetical protein H6Q16_1801 [Bacteroidetes bacterium]|nr:hypothetical protein [Bacteroidota bacterium]
MNISSKAFLGLIVFLSLTISSANAQYYNNYKLNGKVKSFYIKTYDNSKDGYLDTITPSEYVFVDFQNRKETQKHKESKKAKISIKYYDENKNIILDSIFYSRNNVVVTKYYYNSNHKLIKKDDYFNDSIESITNYKYDNANNLLEETLIFNSGDSNILTYTYDSNNNQTSMNRYYHNKKISCDITEYNYKGQKVKDYDYETINDFNLFQYDKRGNLVKKITYIDNEVIGENIFIYNSHNKIIKEKSYYNNELTSLITYSYDNFDRIINTKQWGLPRDFTIEKETFKLDDKGRVIEKKTYCFDDSPTIQQFFYKGYNLVQEVNYDPSNYNYKKKKIEYIYNPDNTLSEKIKYFDAGKFEENDNWEKSTIEKYYYNENKENILIKKTYSLDPEGVYTDSLIYSNNMLTKKYFYTNRNKNNTTPRTYKYDEKKRLIEEETDGYNQERIIYKYNDDTLIYKCEERYDSDGKLDYQLINEWKYDSNKRLIEHTYNQTNQSSKTKYFYNSKGKLKKEIYKDDLIENFIVKRYKYKLFSKDYKVIYSDPSNIKNVYYKYDNKGNLIEERHPAYIEKFEYEYYE